MRTLLTDFLYVSLYLMLAPWILFRKICRGRSLGDWKQRALGCVPRRQGSDRCLWIHAVSVGEVNQLATLLGPLQTQFPDWTVVVSTTTATGMQLAQKKYPQLSTFYFPIDFSWAIRNAFRRIRPSMIILTELELWPNLIRQADHAKTPIAVINGRLSQKSFRNYWRFRPLVHSMFTKLSLVAAQTDDYAQRFVRLGTEHSRVAVTGSIKFDGVGLTQPACDRSPLPHFAISAGIQPGDTLLIAGSTQAPEELIAARIYLKLRSEYPNLRLVIVPRHPHRGKQIAAELTEMGIQVTRRTEPEKVVKNKHSVLLIDTIGELNQWWQAGSVAFVGGSFGSRGGQNMIEPAALGAAVCFGPNTWNFTQVVKLMLDADVATEVADESQFEAYIRKCLEQPSWAGERATRARQFVLTQQGATDRTIELLRPLFNERLEIAKAA